MAKHIGITGGIATGKSSVGKQLEAMGHPVIDADAIVHDALVHNPHIKDAILYHFGSSILDPDTQELNRKAIAEEIFQFPTQRLWMESLLHPLVQAEIHEFFAEHDHLPLVFALVPLIYEGDSQDQYDEVWCVACDEHLQLERLKTERGMSMENIQQRLGCQLPLKDKIDKADRVLMNNGSLRALNAETRAAVIGASVVIA